MYHYTVVQDVCKPFFSFIFNCSRDCDERNRGGVPEKGHTNIKGPIAIVA